MEVKTLIIDDEPLAVQLLTDYVERHPDLTLTAAFHNPIDALEQVQREVPDLVLLDIQMPEMNGLDLARLLRNRCPVILTTAYEEHALRGYELNVVDYLMKPISYERFAQAVAKVTPPIAPATPKEPAPAITQTDTPFFVKNGNRTERLDLDTLLYVTGAGDYLELYLRDGSKVLVLDSMTNFTDRLPAGRFCRIHRSHTVALDKIDFVERRRVVIGDVWLPISESYHADFQKVLES